MSAIESKLRPFCLWHSFALELIGSPFAGRRTGSVTFRELYRAVLICSRGYEPALDQLRKPRLFKLRFAFAHHGWKKRLGQEMAAFGAYLRDYRSSPIHFFDGSGQAAASDFHILTVARLMRHGHMTKRQAWETPEGEAIWLSIALMEAGGQRSNMMTQADITAMRLAGHLN